MKVLLIQPPIEDFYDTTVRTYPLGLLYVGTRAAEVAEVTILDARSGRKKALDRHPFPEVEPFYKDGFSTPFSFFDRYRRYGMSDEEIGDAMRREKPDAVGISALCSAYEAQAVKVASIAKAVNPAIVTVLGGTHPTLFPSQVLSSPDVDYCIRGEGETPFYELISALADGRNDALHRTDGLCFREEGRLHISGVNVETNIDMLPDRRLVSPDDYKIGRKRYAFFLTSRGCPFRCAFCGKPPVPYRKRSLAGVETELDECASLGVEAIDFEDDMLNLDRGRFSDLLHLVAGKGFTFSAMNGIYPGNVDIPMLKEMFDAGFRRLNFSLVDIADPVLRGQKRDHHRSFAALLPFLDDSAFLVEVHFIIGLPEQEPGMLLDTLLFLMEKRLLLGPSIFYLAPGSALCPPDGAVSQASFAQMRSSFMFPLNPSFPRTVTYTFIKLVRFINWVKQAIDRREGMSRLSELSDLPSAGRDEPGRTIVERLFRERRLVRYELKKGDFVDEPADQALIASFFGKAQGRKIRGFKSSRSVTVDI